MLILIACSSRHGSTHEIAERLGLRLREKGHDAEVHDAKSAPPAAAFDAVIVGSAIYIGSWLKEARDYLTREAATLMTKPVWLFSSGPLGDENPQPQGDPPQVTELVAKVQARGYRNFVGRLDKGGLNLAEKLIVKAVGAPYGDFRDWNAIDGWADELAAALRETPVPA